MFGDTTHAAEMARRQRIRAEDLLASGTAHVLVREDQPAHSDPSGFAKTLALEISRAIRTQSISSTWTTAPRTHRSDSWRQYLRTPGDAGGAHRPHYQKGPMT
jgi:acetyl-CoA carboxylase alpha subunit